MPDVTFFTKENLMQFISGAKYKKLKHDMKKVPNNTMQMEINVMKTFVCARAWAGVRCVREHVLCMLCKGAPEGVEK